MTSSTILFCCTWVKNEIDNKGNPTHKQDDVGFLLANFHHILHEFNESVFPAQVQQVFSWSEPKTPWWKVVFGREPKSHWVVVDTYDDYIDTQGVVSGLEAPLEFLDLDSDRALIGVTKLSRKKNCPMYSSFK
jgi:hypothetical protein